MPNPSDLLFEIEQELVKRGHPKMDAETLKEAHARLSDPKVQEMLYGGQISVRQIVDEIDKGLGAVKERRTKRQAPQPQGQMLGQQMMPVMPGQLQYGMN